MAFNFHSQHAAKSSRHYLLDEYVDSKIFKFTHDTAFMMNCPTLEEQHFDEMEIPEQTFIIPTLKQKSSLFTNNEKFNNKYVMKDCINGRYEENAHAASWLADSVVNKAIYYAPLQTDELKEGIVGVSNGVIVRDFPFSDYSTRMVSISTEALDCIFDVDEIGQLEIKDDYKLTIKQIIRDIHGFPASIDICISHVEESGIGLKFHFYCGHRSVEKDEKDDLDETKRKLQCHVKGFVGVNVEKYLYAKQELRPSVECELYLNEHHCRHIMGSQPHNADIKITSLSHWVSHYSAIKTFQEHLMDVDEVEALSGISPKIVSYNRLLYQIRIAREMNKCNDTFISHVTKQRDDDVKEDCDYFKMSYCPKAREHFGKLHNLRVLGHVGLDIWDWRSHIIIDKAKHIHVDGGGGLCQDIYHNNGLDKSSLYHFTWCVPSPFGKIMNCVPYESIDTSKTATTMLKNATNYAMQYNWWHQKKVVPYLLLNKTTFFHLDADIATLAAMSCVTTGKDYRTYLIEVWKFIRGITKIFPFMARLLLCYPHFMAFVAFYDKNLTSINDKLEMKILRLKYSRLWCTAASWGAIELVINELKCLMVIDKLVPGQSVRVEPETYEAIIEYIKTDDMDMEELETEQKSDESTSKTDDMDMEELENEQKNDEEDEKNESNTYVIGRKVSEMQQIFDPEKNDEISLEALKNIKSEIFTDKETYSKYGNMHVWRPMYPELPYLTLIYIEGANCIVSGVFGTSAGIVDVPPGFKMTTFNPAQWNYMRKHFCSKAPMLTNISCGASYSHANIEIENIYRYFKSIEGIKKFPLIKYLDWRRGWMTKQYRVHLMRIQSQYCNYISKLTASKEGWQKGIPSATKAEDLLYIDIFNEFLVHTNVALVDGRLIKNKRLLQAIQNLMQADNLDAKLMKKFSLSKMKRLFESKELHFKQVFDRKVYFDVCSWMRNHLATYYAYEKPEWTALDSDTDED